jgi:hypothetical protein
LFLPKSTTPYIDIQIILTPDMYVIHEHKYIIAGLGRELQELPIGIVVKSLGKRTMNISAS